MVVVGVVEGRGRWRASGACDAGNALRSAVQGEAGRENVPVLGGDEVLDQFDHC